MYLIDNNDGEKLNNKAIKKINYLLLDEIK